PPGPGAVRERRSLDRRPRDRFAPGVAKVARRFAHAAHVAVQADRDAVFEADGLKQVESVHAAAKSRYPQNAVRVLVVEDEQKVANALREGLEEEQYEVAVERSGESAFFRINTETFDLILLDLTLPGR